MLHLFVKEAHIKASGANCAKISKQSSKGVSGSDDKELMTLEEVEFSRVLSI